MIPYSSKLLQKSSTVVTERGSMISYNLIKIRPFISLCCEWQPDNKERGKSLIRLWYVIKFKFKGWIFFIYRLWQRPKENITDSESVWYCNLPVGEKKLSTFFSSLSRATNLSRVYSNQSIRVTGASIQSKCTHDSQTMTGAGHLPVQSISEYVLRRVSDTQIIQPLCVNPVPTPRLLIFSRVDRPTIIAGSTTTWETSQIEAAATHSEAQIMECDPTSIKTEPPFTDYDAQVKQKRLLKPIYFCNTCSTIK